MFRSRVLPFLIWLIYLPLKLTWRFEVHESPELKLAIENNELAVLTHWHGDELGILYFAKRYRASAMTSTSKDGEIINGFLNLIGVPTARGSSTRGGVSALKGILRLAKLGFRPSFAVDGPKGPYHKVKPGALEVAKLLACPIHPLGVACSKSFVFQKSWNKTYLPLPFARIVLVWGKPLSRVPRDLDLRGSDILGQLEAALLDAGQKARQIVATQ
jgi:lysophospholipid acyltransferase (LPLAT)-like uncharacterized protein